MQTCEGGADIAAKATIVKDTVTLVRKSRSQRQW